ncbi:hypothetical protein QFC24_002073 [Naganishia onofrii]|uniref:Uncharacterized protein n=1 Tax=Naganishia onofrii TaxID=1851511 RepID=A0ACC2XQM7_9TREE|nr:hypothetical protein QFC24_002073 [Naganishia onofrii]
MPPKTKQPATPKRTAFVAKPTRPVATRIHLLHRSLVDQINAGHLANGIKTCHKILNIVSSDTEAGDSVKIDVEGSTIEVSKQEVKSNALQTLLFLLLQTDQYDLALDTIESASQSDKLEFEKAYCLYRLHEEEKAKQLVESLRQTEGGSVGLEQESARRLAHLEAQISYRAGNYVRAEEIYNDLLSTCPSDSDEQQDIITNLKATSIHLEFQQTGYSDLLRSTADIQSITALEASAPSFPIASTSTSSQAQASKTSTADPKGKGKQMGGDGRAVGDKKPRHKLPKGAVLGQKFEEDPDRWLPLKQRASYQVSMHASNAGGKKRKQVAKETTGLGTQGSVDTSNSGGGAKTGKSGKKKGGR